VRPGRGRPGGIRRPGTGPIGSVRRRTSARGHDTTSARRNYQRYVALAREAGLKGDAVEAENCYQHAEHFYRLMREQER